MGGITPAGNPATVPFDAGFRIFPITYSTVWVAPMFERSGPTLPAATAPAVWQAPQVPFPTKTAWPALGSPGSSIEPPPAPPVPAAAKALAGTSSSLTSTVPPWLSRNDTTAQTSLRFSPMGGLLMCGMMLGKPWTM